MRTILIVDDEASARYGTRRALEGKYRVVEAGSAAAAREAIASEHPDLILLDLVMPEEDGLSFLRWLRESGNEIPILVILGHGRRSGVFAAELRQEGRNDREGAGGHAGRGTGGFGRSRLGQRHGQAGRPSAETQED